MKLFKRILFWFFTLVFICSFLAGLVTHFIPIDSSKNMSKFQVEWYQLVHYWYIWLTLIISGLGAAVFNTKRY